MTGKEFAAKRKKTGLKQEDIEAITGIPQATISRFELGTVIPDASELERLTASLEYRQMLAIPRPVRIQNTATSQPESHP